MTKIEYYASQYINSLKPMELLELIKEDRDMVDLVDIKTPIQAKKLVEFDNSLIEFYHEYYTDEELKSFIEKFDNENDYEETLWCLFNRRVSKFEDTTYIDSFIRKYRDEPSIYDIRSFYEENPQYLDLEIIKFMMVDCWRLDKNLTEYVHKLIAEDVNNAFKIISNSTNSGIIEMIFALPEFKENVTYEMLLDLYNSLTTNCNIVISFCLRNGYEQILIDTATLESVYATDFIVFCEFVDLTKLGDEVDIPKYIASHIEYLTYDDVKRYNVSWLKYILLKLFGRK